MDPTATVFDIQKSCTHDGPGIRTTVFVKGCPLRCVWCHNPESWRAAPELLYSADRCRNCGKCADVCPVGAHVFDGGVHVFKRERCMACGQCVKRCPSNALELCGRTETVSGVLAEVLKDRPFYESSGGGMTLSGGEPLSQPRFALELTRLAKERGINVCIETSGFCDTSDLLAIAKNTDLFLFDYKVPARLYPKYTGVGADKIRFNLDQLDKAGRRIILRCPMIPGVNLDSEFYGEIADLANAHRNVAGIDLEPYHPLGLSKNSALGKTETYAKAVFLDKGELTPAVDFIRGRTDIPVRIQ